MELFFNFDFDVPMSARDDTLRVDWYDAGEGLYGDYNPDDPEDIHLLRFDVYVRRNNGWEPLEDASYCTLMPADADSKTLSRVLRIIFNEYRSALDDDPDASLKRLGESLSWVDENTGLQQ